MRFVNAAPRMRRMLLATGAMLAVLLAHGCADGLTPLTSSDAPQGLIATGGRRTRRRV